MKFCILESRQVNPDYCILVVRFTWPDGQNQTHTQVYQDWASSLAKSGSLKPFTIQGSQALSESPGTPEGMEEALSAVADLLATATQPCQHQHQP